MKNVLLAIGFVSLLAACAEPGPSASRYGDNDYVTGSNLPRRGSTSLTSGIAVGMTFMTGAG